MSFTLEDVAQKAIELAEANPEFVYKAPAPSEEDIAEWQEECGPDSEPEATCQYIHHTEAGPVGGCLFGQALLGLGVSVDLLRKHEGAAVAQVVEKVLGVTVPSHTGIGLDMVRAQANQDCGEPWGEAIKPLKEAMGK